MQNNAALKVAEFLVNPKLVSVLIKRAIIGNKEVKGYCVLGKEDTVVNPGESIEILKKSKNIKVDIVPGMAHRTPFEIFKEKVNTR